MIPTTTVPIAGKEAAQVLRLVDMLEDHDDVQTVYANFDIPESGNSSPPKFGAVDPPRPQATSGRRRDLDTQGTRLAPFKTSARLWVPRLLRRRGVLRRARG